MEKRFLVLKRLFQQMKWDLYKLKLLMAVKLVIRMMILIMGYKKELHKVLLFRVILLLVQLMGL